MFARIRCLLAAFDRGEFDVDGLALRLDRYVDRSPVVAREPRAKTAVGMPAVSIVWSEP